MRRPRTIYIKTIILLLKSLRNNDNALVERPYQSAFGTGERERAASLALARCRRGEEGKTDGCPQFAALLCLARGAIPSSLSCDAQLLAACST